MVNVGTFSCHSAAVSLLEIGATECVGKVHESPFLVPDRQVVLLELKKHSLQPFWGTIEGLLHDHF